MACCEKYEEALEKGTIKRMYGIYHFVEEIKPFPPNYYPIGNCPFCGKQILIENEVCFTGK
jgi:hypothetical protein